MERLYFDWAATSKPDPEILRETMETAMNSFGNPSSAHQEGKNASAMLSQCRARVASILNAKPEQIIFTSGGTESNNLIVFSLLNRKRSPEELLISGFEHAAVYEPAKSLKELGWKLNILPPLKGGLGNPKEICDRITPGIEFVSVMTVNNETGLLSEVNGTARGVRSCEKAYGRKIFFHTDGVQALGKQKVDLEAWDADSVSFSGHKIGGPRGTGILYLKNPKNMLSRGGGQEMGFRGGTENLPGIAGLAAAIEKRYDSLEEDLKSARKIKEYLVVNLADRCGASIIPGQETALSDNYSPWILMASFPPVPGEVLARVINDRGAAVSTGSACSSRQKKTFRVSDGLGISRELAFSALRFSWGPDTTIKECAALIKIVSEEFEILRRVTGKRK